MAEKKIAGTTAIRNKIKKVLVEQGSYTQDLDFMIELCAGNLYVYRLAMKDIRNLDGVTYTVTSREGNDKQAVHPAFRLLGDISEQLRRSLRELRLTLVTLEGVSDEMDELIDTVNNVGNTND